MNKTFITTLDGFKIWVEPLIASGQFDKVSFDTESQDGLDWDLARPVGISFCNGVEACYYDFNSSGLTRDSIDYLRYVFSKIKKLVAQNFPYDLKTLIRSGIIRNIFDTVITRNIFDTMTALHLIDENGSSGLKESAFRYKLTNDIKKWTDVKDCGYSSQKFYDYAITDSIWTWQLHEILGVKLKQLGLLDLFFKIEMPFQFVLTELEMSGLTLDLQRLGDIRNRLQELWLNYEIKMLACLGREHTVQKTLFGDSIYLSPVNFRSSPQLVKVITKLGIDIPLNKDGKLSVGKKTLLKLSGKHKFIDTLMLYKTVTKLLNGFVDKLPNHVCRDLRIHPSFNNTGTVTGRLSCSNPNMQQLPKNKKSVGANIRECFVAALGKKLVVADYSGQELRGLTEVTKDPGLIHDFDKGKDIHFTTANSVMKLGVPEESLYDSHPDYESYKNKFKVERDNIKNGVVFPIVYGTTAMGVSATLNISETKAQSYIDGFFKLYPGVKAAIQKTIDELKTKHYVRNLVGRYRRFPDFSNRAIRQAFNFKIQGYSADMIRLAAIKVLALKTTYPDWQLKMCLIVHDEIVCEVNEQYASEAAKAIKECMETAVKLCIPLVADVGIGDNYHTAKP